VPLIVWSVFGFLHTFGLGPGGWRLSHAVGLAALAFYASFRNLRMLALMTGFLLLLFATFPWIPWLREISIVVFAGAWLGQFVGHKIEGKKPSFFKDLLFLFIGPVWVLKKAFPALF
jgi:uncharacterized membrane protein YGL010W